MKKLLPLLLALLGTAAGTAAGLFLAPSHDTPAPEHATEGHDTGDPHAAPAPAQEAGHGDDAHGGGGAEYVKLNNQFVVPVVDGDRVQSLVVLSLSLEVTGAAEQVYDLEPKLRDSFLRVLFDHANIGGFEGNFTATQRLELLRRSLLDAARNVMGDAISDVLITEIARQDN